MTSLRSALEQKIHDLEVRGEAGEPHLFLTLSLGDLKEMLAVNPAIEPATDLVPKAEVRSVLEGIYEDARSAITAPVHQALMGAASRLERLLGISPGTPGFQRIGSGS